MAQTGENETVRGGGAAGPIRRRRGSGANLVLATAAAAGSGLVENAWVGRRLRVGQAVLRVLMPTPRCSMVTQPNGAEGKDPGVLRAIVRDAAQNLGVYAEVVEPGVVREGDEAVLLDT